MMSLYQKSNLFPELVLHEICDFLNLSELKAFRLVCVQWYSVARTHLQIRGQLRLSSWNEKFIEFSGSNQSGGYSPVRNLEVFVCESPRCMCEDCQAVSRRFRQFDDSTLEAIVAKCTSGIKSFGLYVEQRVQDNVAHNHLMNNHEKLLLLRQFKILKELNIYDPFKLTPDSGINSVFRKLTSLYLGFNCGDESFAAKIFNECCYLKSLTLGPSDDHPFVTPRHLVKLVRILDALSHAMKRNEYLQIEKMNIDCRRRRSLYDAASDTITIFSKLREMNLKFKVLDLSFKIDCREPNSYLSLMNEVQDLLESQKESLVKLVLPDIWKSSQSELKYVPHMKNLKDLKSNINFHLPLMELQSKFPVLNAVTIEFFHRREIAIGGEYNCPLQFAHQLKQNIPPCTTVTELTLSYFRNGALLAGFKKMFPNIQSLTIDMECEDLQKLWRCWPKVKELNLTVTDINKRHDPFYQTQRIDFLTELELSVKFHAGLVGMPENDCEALLESSVSFLTLKVEKYNYNLPSIRDFSELTKLHLKCGVVACNIALMLGVLPIKSLMEVYVEDGQMTIDCVQHLLSCCPNINRWEFIGSCILERNYRALVNPYPKEWINWTVSSSNNDKHQPIYDQRRYRYIGDRPLPDSKYKTRLRSVNKYGRGKCLIWTLYHVPTSPYVYK